MPDVFTQAKRSAVMARIRSRGNRDTEGALAALFRRHGITGWRRQFEIRNLKSQTRNLRVRPDFVFPERRLAVFVDGCFWHGCPLHSPPTRWLRKSAMPAAPTRRRGTRSPRTGKRFWRDKLAANRARDRKASRALRAAGWRVLRVWEHDLARQREASVVRRLRRVLA
jgi:DNA mismatch endonuclease (patch repair protein)